MSLVVIDLIPALLSREGRDRSSDFRVAPEAVEALGHLYAHHRLVGLTDADVSSTTVRRVLEDAHIAEYFDGVGTSAGFGPSINPRVVRRMVHAMRGHGPVVFVTGREPLARAMGRSRFGVVLTAHDEFGAVPDAVASLASGRVSP